MNPRAPKDNLISSQARYGHFATSPCDLHALYYKGTQKNSQAVYHFQKSFVISFDEYHNRSQA